MSVFRLFLVCLGVLSLFSSGRFAFGSSLEVSAIQEKKKREAYPEIPGLEVIRLPQRAPQVIVPSREVSVGIMDTVLEKARTYKVFEDFKELSDARRKTGIIASMAYLCGEGLTSFFESFLRSSNGKAMLKYCIELAYDRGPELLPFDGLVHPKWSVSTSSPDLNSAFAYVESEWQNLVRGSPIHSDGSLLVTPYPVLVPAGRFQEIYYWDTYFGVKGLLATERFEIAEMQAENLLGFIRSYGFIPNGGRDYYLTRSQPPVISSIVREIFEALMSHRSILPGIRSGAPKEEHALKWLSLRAYPLIVRDYDRFWMNPETRYDPGTGLNHHWDALDLPRPERHSFDREEELGKSYRDVRAAAESGLDFTMIFQGEATHIAGVLLNSLLYKTEKDLEWMAGILGLYPEEARFRAAADKRKKAMNQYLWDSKRGRFENYHLKDQKRIALLSADVFIPLFVKMASKDQATQVRKTLAILEKGGGIMASELMNSPGQWDGSNGWAPYQIFVMEGLRNYGFNDDAQRIAGKWVGMISKVYRKHRKIYERLDVIREDRPASDHAKYPPQEGFLWTNASFVWAMKEILRIPFNVF